MWAKGSWKMEMEIGVDLNTCGLGSRRNESIRGSMRLNLVIVLLLKTDGEDCGDRPFAPRVIGL
jgi:hypothetical protein